MDFEFFMRRCLELALEAQEMGEVPIGAVVVCDGEIVGLGRNSREQQHSVTGHAEIQALVAASQKLQSWRLNGCTLFSTLEPCVMCAGAIVQSRVATVVYGANDEKGGGHTLFSLLSSEKLNHRVDVVSGVLKEECSEILKNFFKQMRGRST